MDIKFRHFLYISNLLSFSRIALIVPVLCFLPEKTLEADRWLVILVGFGILTDYLDGLLSRRLDQITDLGKFLDPIADKLILGIGFVGLAYYREFPIVLVNLLIYRDLVILVGGLLVTRKQSSLPTANIWGKLNTIVYAFAFFFYFIDGLYAISVFFMACSLVMVLVSGISYYMQAENLLEQARGTKWTIRIGLGSIAFLIVFFSVWLQAQLWAGLSFLR